MAKGAVLLRVLCWSMDWWAQVRQALLFQEWCRRGVVSGPVLCWLGCVLVLGGFYLEQHFNMQPTPTLHNLCSG